MAGTILKREYVKTFLREKLEKFFETQLVYKRDIFYGKGKF